jgi:hypothetical protein
MEMNPRDLLIDMLLDRVIGVILLLALGMAFAGWFGFFRLIEQREVLRTENARLEGDFREVCLDLNELRASVAGGWPVSPILPVPDER